MSVVIEPNTDFSKGVARQGLYLNIPVVATYRFEPECDHVHKAVTWVQSRFDTVNEVTHSRFCLNFRHGGNYERVQGCARSFFGPGAYFGHPGRGVYLDNVLFETWTGDYGPIVSSYVVFVRE